MVQSFFRMNKKVFRLSLCRHKQVIADVLRWRVVYDAQNVAVCENWRSLRGQILPPLGVGGRDACGGELDPLPLLNAL